MNFKPPAIFCYCQIAHRLNTTKNYTRKQLSLLAISLSLTTILATWEFLIGHNSGISCLVAEAGHLLVDVVAIASTIILSFLVQLPNLNQKYRNQLSKIAVLTNIISTTVIAFGIIKETFEHLYLSSDGHNLPVIPIAIAACLINVINILLLHYSQINNFTLKTLSLHYLIDTTSSIGVLVVAIAQQKPNWFSFGFWGWHWLNLLVGILVTSLIVLEAIQTILNYQQRQPNFNSLSLEINSQIALSGRAYSLDGLGNNSTTLMHQLTVKSRLNH